MNESGNIKILVEIPENPNQRRYNVATELSKKSFDTEVPVPRWRTGEHLSTDTVAGALISALTDDVPGIVWAQVDRYSIDLTINPVFEWGAVEAGVLDAIASVLDAELTVQHLVLGAMRSSESARLRAIRITFDDEPSELFDVTEDDFDDDAPQEVVSDAWGGMPD